MLLRINDFRAREPGEARPVMTPAEFVNSLPAEMFEDDDQIFEDRLHREVRREVELSQISKALGKARRWIDIARKRQTRAREKGRREPTQEIQGDARMVRSYLLDALAVLDSIIQEQQEPFVPPRA